jgi:hypothetical protein
LKKSECGRGRAPRIVIGFFKKGAKVAYGKKVGTKEDNLLEID